MGGKEGAGGTRRKEQFQKGNQSVEASQDNEDEKHNLTSTPPGYNSTKM